MNKVIFRRKDDYVKFIKEEILDNYTEYEKSLLDFQFGEPISYPIGLAWTSYKVCDNEITISGVYFHPKDFDIEKRKSTNIYYLGFRWKRDVNVVKVTANQLANELLGSTDDIMVLKWNNERDEDGFGISDQGYTYHLWFDGHDYVIEFADDPHFFNIYEYKKDEEDPTKWYGEHMVAENIPWICLKIEDENGNEIYNLNNEI